MRGCEKIKNSLHDCRGSERTRRHCNSLLAAFIVLALPLRAQAPLKVDKVCSAGDIEFFGLTCSEDDPCPVFLELAGLETNGLSLFLTGNLHTVNTTLFALLLRSDDAGKTWTEPQTRVRSAALDQIQFADFQHGWIGGVKLEPLPKDPFLLITADGGTTWQPAPLFEDTHFGSIQQFWFDSATHGQLILDASQGQNKRYELYETKTGGKSWEQREAAARETQLAQARPREYATWRVRADAEAYRVERKAEANAARSWDTVASFAIHAGDCH